LETIKMFKNFEIKTLNSKGFTIVEVLVSVAIFSFILSALLTFFWVMSNSNAQTKANKDASENAKRVLEYIAYEIRSAKSIYTPTSTASQLSLETSRYLPEGESVTFIDFYRCGNAVCLKKEGKDPIPLTSNSVSVPENGLVFSFFPAVNPSSVKISLTVNSSSKANGGSSYSSTLTTTASLRSY